MQNHNSRFLFAIFTGILHKQRTRIHQMPQHPIQTLSTRVNIIYILLVKFICSQFILKFSFYFFTVDMNPPPYDQVVRGTDAYQKPLPYNPNFAGQQ